MQHSPINTSISNKTSIMHNSMINMLLRVFGFATTPKNSTLKQKTITTYISGVTNSERGVTNSERGVANSECGVPNSERGVANSERGVPNSERGVANSERGVPNYGNGVPNDQIGVPICPMLIVLNLIVNLFYKLITLSSTHTASYFPTLFIGALVQPTIRAPCSAKQMNQMSY